ncbi:hypothetical protein [Sanguibacter sp. 25GB23B1]|uniref:hypothetical protein n=1 Tax=unclassified Sanguibacter TaxID=2645534 RepID=UPI0032AFBDDE
MDLESAADELYGQPLTEFVPTRNRLEKDARGSGDRPLAQAVRDLRKPSQAAWAVNQIVRQSPEILDDILHLGDDLRTAQEGGDTLGLRRLAARRHDLFATLRRRAEELVAEDGRQLGTAAALALERTVGAAMSDPRAAEVVRSGLLVVDLENAGWGLIDLDGARANVERPASGRARESAEGQDPAAALRDAEDARARAEDEAAHAATTLDEAKAALDAVATAQQRLADRKAALLAELHDLEAGEERTADEMRSARKAQADATRTVARTARLVERARQRVEDLTSRG